MAAQLLKTLLTVALPACCCMLDDIAKPKGCPPAACCCSVDMKASLEVYWQTAVANRESMLETEVSPQLSRCCTVSVCRAQGVQTVVRCTDVDL